MANPTTNFNWQMPTASDLVTDLPADFEVFGQAVDTALVDLKGGTTGQILAKATNTDMDFTWITNDVGDITAVTAGSGLSGGGTSGAVSLALDLASANVFTAAQTATRFLVTGSTIATNGMYLPAANSIALTTSSTDRLRIDSVGNFALNNVTNAGIGFLATVAGTTGTNNSSFYLNPTLHSGTTGTYRGYYSLPSTAAAAFTVGNLRHFYALSVTLGAGSAVTNQVGFYADAALTSATNNYGFEGAIASGTNRFNLYMSGTAANFLQGRTGIGAGINTTYQLRVTNAQSATDITWASTNFAAQTADSFVVQNSASSLVWGVTAAGFMKYISGNTATTVGAAGVASALPANPTGYLKIDIGGTEFKVPYYAA